MKSTTKRSTQITAAKKAKRAEAKNKADIIKRDQRHFSQIKKETQPTFKKIISLLEKETTKELSKKYQELFVLQKQAEIHLKKIEQLPLDVKTKKAISDYKVNIQQFRKTIVSLQKEIAKKVSSELQTIDQQLKAFENKNIKDVTFKELDNIFSELSSIKRKYNGLREYFSVPKTLESLTQTNTKINFEQNIEERINKIFKRINNINS